MTPARSSPTLATATWLLHALYFVGGGVWSVVGSRSFQAVSGPKVDYWLVRTVGGLLTVVGGVIGAAGWRRRLTPEIAWLGIGTSAVLTAIDLVYTSKGRIRRVYLLDAVANTILIAGWAATLRRGMPDPDS
jgi:hypothetical protein